MTKEDFNTNANNQLRTVRVIHRCKGKPHEVLEDGKLDEQKIYDLQKSYFEKSKFGKDDSCRCYRYFGTKQELINEGLAIDGWFPRDDENNRNTLRIVFTDNFHDAIVINEPRTRVKSKMRCIGITKSGEDRFILEDFLPQSVQEKLYEKRQARYNKYEYERAIETEKELLANLARSGEDAKQRLVSFYINTQSILVRHIDEGLHGYHLPKATTERIRGKYAEIEELLEESNFYLNKNERLNIENEIKAKKVKVDPNFKAFLNSVMEAK